MFQTIQESDHALTDFNKIKLTAACNCATSKTVDQAIFDVALSALSYSGTMMFQFETRAGPWPMAHTDWPPITALS